MQEPGTHGWQWNCQPGCRKEKGKRKELSPSNILVRNHGSIGSTHKVAANFGHHLLLVVPGLPAVSSLWQFPRHEVRAAEQGLHAELGTNRKRSEPGHPETGQKTSQERAG